MREKQLEIFLNLFRRKRRKSKKTVIKRIKGPSVRWKLATVKKMNYYLDGRYRN